MRRLIQRLICLLAGHRWVTHEIPAGGVLTIIRRCERCHHVDIESIRQAGWNRAARRRWSRAVGVRRRLRRLA